MKFEVLEVVQRIPTRVFAQPRRLLIVHLAARVGLRALRNAEVSWRLHSKGHRRDKDICVHKFS